MKKIILAVSMISYIFISCEKDDDNNQEKYNMYRLVEVDNSGISG